MKLVILCVRDVRADAFGNPFFLATLGQGVRSFEDEINRSSEENMMFKHPQDFELFHLGQFDTSNAEFDLLRSPQQLCAGSSCVRAVPGDKRQLPLTGVEVPRVS